MAPVQKLTVASIAFGLLSVPLSCASRIRSQKKTSHSKANLPVEKFSTSRSAESRIHGIPGGEQGEDHYVGSFAEGKESEDENVEDEAVDVVDEVHQPNPSLRERLVRFYEHYNPEKIPQVDYLINKYPGKESKMWYVLHTKYGPEPGATTTSDEEDDNGDEEDYFSEEAGLARIQRLKERLVKFYQHYNPDKIPQIDYLINKYPGRERDMWYVLHKKYGPEPPTTTTATTTTTSTTTKARSTTTTAAATATTTTTPSPPHVPESPPPTPALNWPEPGQWKDAQQQDGDWYEIYSIGDSHGDHGFLKSMLLSTGKFIVDAEEELVWRRDLKDRKFEIVMLGDYIDRGTHSLENLLLLKKLQEDPEYGSHLVVLLGNHESMVLRFDMGAMQMYGDDAVERWKSADRLHAWYGLDKNWAECDPVDVDPACDSFLTWHMVHACWALCRCG